MARRPVMLAALAAVCVLAIGLTAQSAQQPRAFPAVVREATAGVRSVKDRAYLYAPPPVTHSIKNENDSAACLQCHAREKDVALRKNAIAPIPHAEFSQCLQCHLKGTAANADFRPNGFVGLDFPGKGARAYEGAPPTIPHRLFMRDNCQACHGPTGDHSIRTPHPERSQCRQCHAAEATQTSGQPVLFRSVATVH
ncbi:hypothetical protein HZA57_09915 [Candidatus Poribacteria bacterium]|nr:hypothetical protein [Candidatus Poribacteria bacterium]